MGLEGDLNWISALEEELSDLDIRENTSCTTTDQSHHWTLDLSANPWEGSTTFQQGLTEDTIAYGNGGDIYDTNIPSMNSEPETQPEQDTQMRETDSCTQTEPWTDDKAVNTDQDLKTAVQAVEQCHQQLLQQCDSLLRQKEQEEIQLQSQVKLLQLQKEEGIRQQQVLIDKMDALRVKLKLNCYKTTRKNFTVKKLELTGEKEKLEEEQNRLTQELQEAEKRLASLIEEQGQERDSWEAELSALHKLNADQRKEAEEACQAALRDELTALEFQRDLMVSEVEDWLAEAEKYLNYLKMELPSFNALQHMQLRIEWEKKIAAIRTSLGTLQRQYNEQLQLLQSGQQLDSLPPVTPPALPPVPTVEMKIHAMMQPQHPTVAMGVKPPPHVLPQAPAATPSLFSTAIPFAVPQQPLAGAQRVPQPAPGPANTPNPTSQPAGKLEQLLEKLRARFPQCNRSQLTAVLQQIKMSRGTMAGLSMEELTQQVAQRLAQSETPRQSHGPIGPPSATARTFPSSVPQAHVTAHLPHRSPAPQAIFNTRPPVAARPSSRKLCLVCQNQVEPGTQQVLSCTHVVHKECISVWLRTSKNNTCPFCPSAK